MIWFVDWLNNWLIDWSSANISRIHSSPQERIGGSCRQGFTADLDQNDVIYLNEYRYGSGSGSWCCHQTGINCFSFLHFLFSRFKLFDWVNDWLIEFRLNDWLIEWMIDWLGLIDWCINSWNDWLMDLLMDWLMNVGIFLAVTLFSGMVW